MNFYDVSHSIWRRLPKRPRQAAYARLSAWLSPQPDRHAPTQPRPPWIVAGVLRAPTGLGQAARLAVAALRASGETVFIADVTAALRQPEALPVPDTDAIPEGPGTVLLFGVPPTTGHALRAIGSKALASKRIIGCWIWELEHAPDFWARDAALAHEIAAASPFGCKAIEATIGRPVRHLIHPVMAELLPAVAPPSPRTTFRIGFACDFGSTTARKNPLAVIAAFEKAFPRDSDVILTLKVRNPAASPTVAATLRAAGERLGRRFELVTGDLARADSLAWLADLDLYVSLHRSEGFGLPIAEAMRLGVPVAVTAWSAPAEFVDESCGYLVPYRLIPVEDESELYALPGARWAEPDIEAAAEIMRRARRSPTERAAKAAAARTRIAERYSTEVFMTQLCGP
ncbi:glycosyltransferase [Chelatococcus sp. GCM10030263]|uniref:glycosyltransferase n=1 Tax=Chelatococcus sp. GCM10030263 TaxID=3273387 RepID=UPI00361C974C